MQHVRLRQDHDGNRDTPERAEVVRDRWHEHSATREEGHDRSEHDAARQAPTAAPDEAS